MHVCSSCLSKNLGNQFSFVSRIVFKFDADPDPDPTPYFDADQDHAFHFDADPDPSFFADPNH
jgi:hypothetical protein